MSLLNRPSHGLFNILIVLHRCVYERGSLPQERLLRLCCPPPLDEDRARKTLNLWVKFGLFRRDKEGGVSLAPDLPYEGRPERLPAVLRELAFRPENNRNFWEAEEADAADFTRALAWGLAIGPIEIEQRNWEGIDELQQLTLEPPTRAIQNDTRWPGFCAWAGYLGFGRSAHYARGFVLDAAPAIADVLPDVFAGASQLPVTDFVGELARRLPVLDGGEYRTRVEGKLRPQRWQGPAPDELSESLSLALERLRIENRLAFDEESDTARRNLKAGGRVLRTVSRVEHRGGNECR